MSGLILGLLFFLVSVKPVAAAPTVTIVSAPSSASAGDAFEVKVGLSGFTADEVYYYKFYGGIDSNNDQVKTINGSTDLSYTSSWSSFPSVTVPASGEVEFTGKAKVTAGAGNYKLYVRLAKTTDTGSQYNSTAMELAAVAPSATPTIPTNTPTITQTPSPTPRTLTVSILSLPAVSALGNTFEVKFKIQGGNGNYEYYAKGFGGVNDNYSIETATNNGWLGYTGDWEKMPKFKTNDEGTLEAVVRLRAISTKETGLYRVRVKIKESIGPKESEADLKTIQIDKSPSATPTVKPSPTPEPTNSMWPLPTAIVSGTPSEEPTPGEEIKVDDVAVTPTPEDKTKVNLAGILPIGLIGGGCLFLLVPFIISKLKK